MSPHLQPVIDWFISFNGMTYSEAKARLSTHALFCCEQDVDAAIVFEMVQQLEKLLEDDDIERTTDAILQNYCCILAVDVS